MKISDFINLFKNDSANSPEKQSFLQPNRSFVPLNSPADNKTAVSFINSRFADNNGSNKIDEKEGKNSDPVVYKVIVSFPKGKTELTYDQLEKAVIKTILQKNGINPSVAAVERLAERHTIDFTPKYDADKRDYVFSEKNGLMMNVSDKKANRYDVPISASVEKAIIGDIELAKNITASGEKAFSELSMNERLEMVFDRAGKDLPQDVRDALKLIDPKMLVGSMAIGAALSSLVSKGLIASQTLVLVGGAVTMAQLISYMGDAEHILNQVAQAKKPEDLDVPAKQTAELIKSGAVDIFLTVAGYGVGKVAPKISKTAAKISEKAGQFGDDIANAANKAQAKGAKIMDDFNEGLQKLGKTLIPETELATPNGAKFDPSELRTRKTPLEKINDPKKIVTVDSNGKPSGIRFRDDYEAHIKKRDFSKTSQRSGVNGSHNMKEFEQYDIAINKTLTKDSVKILSKTPHPTVKGVYKIEYQMPSLDRTGKLTGQWRYKTGTTPFEKTVYDSSIISDKQMAQWGREAFADAVQNGTINIINRFWTGTSSNGIKFGGHIDPQTKAVRTFFVEF